MDLFMLPKIAVSLISRLISEGTIGRTTSADEVLDVFGMGS